MNETFNGFGKHEQAGEYVRRPDGVVEPSVLKQRVTLVQGGQIVEGSGVLVRDYPECGCPSTAPEGGACVPGNGGRCCKNHLRRCRKCGDMCCFKHAKRRIRDGHWYCTRCLTLVRRPDWIAFATVVLIAIALLILLKLRG